jgi:adenylosuccinate lyase
VSPIDGRYSYIAKSLSFAFSECSLFLHRSFVEYAWLVRLVETAPWLKEKEHAAAILPQLAAKLAAAAKQVKEDHPIALALADGPFAPPASGAKGRKRGRGDSDVDVQKLFAHFKGVERTTNHDIKAVEYELVAWIQEACGVANCRGCDELASLVHFGLTSQDINNTVMPFVTKQAVTSVMVPNLVQAVIAPLHALAVEHMDTPMLARTHGQPATPTRLGKEVLVMVERLLRSLQVLEGCRHEAKFGGATGGLNALMSASSSVAWRDVADTFVADLGLARQQNTTQIEHYDAFGTLCSALKRINTILIDACRDFWQYISLGYFVTKAVATETGSSTMPHKVNPIDFENAEGNAGIANALLTHFADKLPVSRMQRDLSDSTVLRNIGVAFGHSLLAYRSMSRGISKLRVNQDALRRDLGRNFVVVGEAVQTILRRECVAHPYEKVKALTRGVDPESIDVRHFHAFIDGLDRDEVTEAVREELKALAPETYLGERAELPADLAALLKERQ